MFRIDHFRGFVGYWMVHASETTAINGKWVDAPAAEFFEAVLTHIPKEAIIAEDLGIITPDVRDVIQRFGFPGMKVLLFAFGEDLPLHPYAPHNHENNCVIYTGTHDNNTIIGWYKNEIDNKTKKRISDYIGRELSEKTIHWELIRLAMMSVADTVIIPLQDILGLDAKDRMNLPATSDGNWEWRMSPEQLTPSIRDRLSGITKIYGRDISGPQ
jgi:4-alpha-glucanotransferase